MILGQYINQGQILFKRWITLSAGYKSIQWITQWFPYHFYIHLIVIYPVDSTIQHLNNRGQENKEGFNGKQPNLLLSIAFEVHMADIPNKSCEVRCHTKCSLRSTSIVLTQFQLLCKILLPSSSSKAFGCNNNWAQFVFCTVLGFLQGSQTH